MAKIIMTTFALALAASAVGATATSDPMDTATSDPMDCGVDVCPTDPVLLQRGHHHSKTAARLAEDDKAELSLATEGTLLVAGTAEAAASATMRAPTSAEKQAFLAEHNKYRCMHGVPPVKWSDAVAQKATSYVSPMTQMKHADSYNIKPPAGPAGENIYWSSNAGTAAGAVAAWYSEVNDCRGGPTGFTDGCQKANKPTGHFTALIWKGVKEIGCGFSNSKAPTVILCRYKAGNSLSQDTPNMGGAYKSQVLTRKKTAEQCGGSSGSSSSSVYGASPAAAGSKAKTCTSTDTGGTCKWWQKCYSWRKATCQKGKCVCTGGKCAVNGKCVTEGDQKAKKPPHPW